MRVLHSAFMAHYEPGVLQQLIWESEAASSLGLDWFPRIFVPDDAGYDSSSRVVVIKRIPGAGGTNVAARLLRWSALRRAYYEWLQSQVENYDLILLRHSLSDPFEARFIARQRVPVLTVHHTLELPELLGQGGFVGHLRASLEEVLGGRALRSARAIVGVTHEIERYEQSRLRSSRRGFVYPNGIAYSGLQGQICDKREDVPNIIFVASHFTPWHGLDLLLSDLENCGSDFVLHLVGRVFDADRERAAEDRRVVMHGLLKPAQIRDLTRRCDVGLASFALHRKGMQEACTLKVREYLAAGVPVYSGYRDVFPEHFRFYRNGKPEFSTILQFAMECRGASRGVVAESAYEYISKKVLLQKFYASLLEQFGV